MTPDLALATLALPGRSPAPAARWPAVAGGAVAEQDARILEASAREPQ